jgi:hypothetical protein
MIYDFKFMIFDLFAKYLVTEPADALGVKRVTGFVGDDTSLQTQAKQRQIADDIEQFMPCRFVRIVQRREVA